MPHAPAPCEREARRHPDPGLDRPEETSLRLWQRPCVDHVEETRHDLRQRAYQLTDEMIDGRRISNLLDPDFGVYHSCDEIAVCQNAEPFMPI